MAGTPSVSLSLTSPADVLSGNAVCSNTTVEFTCTASSVETLGWHIDNIPFESWYIPTTSSGTHFRERDHIEVYLEKMSFTNSEPLTVSSRLRGRVDQGLNNGSEISCIGTTTDDYMESLNLRYSLVLPGKYHDIHDQQ